MSKRLNIISEKMASHKGSLIRRSLFLSLAMGVAGMANLFFQIVMCRLLTPSDYGVLMTMVGLIYVMNVPAEAIRAVLVFLTSDGSGGNGLHLLHRMNRMVVIGSLPLIVVLVVASGALRAAFQLDSIWPLAVTGLAGVVTFCMTACQGMWLGRQKLGVYAGSMNAWMWGRLACAIVLAWFGWGATGALTGMALGALLGMIVPLPWAMSDDDGGSPASHVEWRVLYRSLFGTLALYGSFMLLANLDVLLAKHCFSKEAAGLFAQGSMLVHMVWLLPYPVILAMLPDASKRGHCGLPALDLVIKSGAISGGVSLVAIIGILAGRYVISLWVFGQAGHMMSAMLPAYMLAGFPLGWCFVMMNAEMVRRTCWGAVPVTAACIVLWLRSDMGYMDPGLFIRWYGLAIWSVFGILTALTMWQNRCLIRVDRDEENAPLIPIMVEETVEIDETESDL